jgi:hypothetical protein
MIKKILISSGVMVVVAGLVFGALYFIKQAQVSPASEAVAATILDHSKDYGACGLVDSASLKKALGDSAADLQQAQDMGIVGNKAIGEGVNDLVSDSQICVYAFGPGGTLENGYNSGDAFIIERIIYSNESGPKTFIAQIQSQSTAAAVDGSLGDYAFYGANTTATGPGATVTFKLEVFTDKTSVSYAISQPAESTSFTAETAKTALIQIATLAK